MPHRAVTIAPRDAKHLAAGDVDHRRMERVVPAGAAEPGVVGVLFGAGHEADAISMLVPRRYGCGFARPGLFKRQVAPALWGARAWSATTRPPATPARTRATSPGTGRTRSSLSSADLAGIFGSVGIKPLAVAG